MKILGGQVDEKDGRLAAHYESALRYGLGLPGLSVVILGMKNAAEVRKAAKAVRTYQP